MILRNLQKTTNKKKFQATNNQFKIKNNYR